MLVDLVLQPNDHRRSVAGLPGLPPGLCKRRVRGGEIAAQLPDAEKQQGVGVAIDWQICKIIHRLVPPGIVDFPGKPISRDDRSNFYIQKMGRISV